LRIAGLARVDAERIVGCHHGLTAGRTPVDPNVGRWHQIERDVQPLQRSTRVFQMHVAVAERAAVMRPNDEKPDGFRIELLQHIANQEKVAQALGHLLVVDVDEAVVHPAVGKRLAGRAFALRDFVFVMGKRQVGATAMDVERFSQQLACHGRTLDVPAGPTGAELTGPLDFVGFAVLGAFPEHRIERIVLAVEHRDALARVQFVDRLAGQLAVTGKLAHRVVHVAIGRAVRQALLLQRPDHRQHLRDVVRGARFVRRAFDPQRIGVFMERIDHAIGQGANAFAVFHGTPDDLVVDVGNVAYVVDAIAASPQPALHHVERDHGTRMPQMTKIIDGHATNVHADPTGLQGGKVLYLTRQCVEDAQTHGDNRRLFALAGRG